MITVDIKERVNSGAVTITAQPGTSIIAERLKGYNQQLAKGWRFPLSEIAFDFFETERKWLLTQGEGTWAPLNPRYAVKKKKALGATRPILYRTGLMFKVFTGAQAPALITNNRMTIRTDAVPYWRAHEHGAPGRRLRKRPVLAANLQRKTQGNRAKVKEWGQVLTRWVKGEVGTKAYHGIVGKRNN